MGEDSIEIRGVALELIIVGEGKTRSCEDRFDVGDVSTSMFLLSHVQKPLLEACGNCSRRPLYGGRRPCSLSRRVAVTITAATIRWARNFNQIVAVLYDRIEPYIAVF